MPQWLPGAGQDHALGGRGVRKVSFHIPAAFFRTDGGVPAAEPLYTTDRSRGPSRSCRSAHLDVAPGARPYRTGKVETHARPATPTHGRSTRPHFIHSARRTLLVNPILGTSRSTKRPRPRRHNGRLGAVAAALLATTITSAAPASAAPSKTTLTILVGEQYPAITKAVSVFEKAHPGVTVQVQVVAGSAFLPKTLVEVASNNPPDLFQNFGGGLLLKSFVDVGYVANLTSFWKSNSALTKAYIPSLMGPATINGRIYGVPYQGVQPVLVYYNKADFAAAKISPPTTWTAFLSDVSKLKQAGFIPVAQGNDAWALMMWPEYLALRDGGPNAGHAIVSGNPAKSAAIVEAGNQSASLVKTSPFEPGFLGITYDAGEPTELVGTGKAAMELQGSWEFSNFQSKTPNALKQNNIGFFPFPSGGNTSTAKAVAGNPTIYLSVSQKSQHKQLAEEFMKETLLQPWFSKLLISEGAVPPVRGVLSELQKYAKGPETANFLSWQYHLLANSSYFQQSWDQASLPAKTQAIYTAVSKLFAGQLTGSQFAAAMSK